MKNTFLLGAAICVLGLLTACDATPLGKGYVYFSEYPNCNVCKKIAWLGGEYDVVLPPTEQWKDKGDLAVNVFWDDTTILAVGCKELMANDTICWKLNKKTGIVSITIKAQDPLVCATIASSACENLQKFIVDYRTHKAKVDYNYYKSLCKDSKAEYEEARKKYARYADANQDIFLMHYKSKLDDLENEMQQKYNIYTTINTQMHSAAAKLQEATPAFTTIQTATVPIKPAGPKRVLTAIALTILVFFGLSGWILIKQR